MRITIQSEKAKMRFAKAGVTAPLGFEQSLLWTFSSDFLAGHSNKVESCAQNTCECCISLACLSKIMEFFCKPSTPRGEMKMFVCSPIKCCVVNASNEIPRMGLKTCTWTVFILRLTSPILPSLEVNYWKNLKFTFKIQVPPGSIFIPTQIKVP